jgi:hypothetical protein
VEGSITAEMSSPDTTGTKDWSGLTVQAQLVLELVKINCNFETQLSIKLKH